MQSRMQKHQMEKKAVDLLLARAMVGHVSTINENGYPYTVAVHFVYENNKIYFHGLSQGQKIDNIKRCSKVCFEVDEMKSLMLDNLDTACKADTEYESVVILGSATILSDLEKRKSILQAIVKKYAPELPDMPYTMMNGTAVVEIAIEEITGKYHK